MSKLSEELIQSIREKYKIADMDGYVDFDYKTSICVDGWFTLVELETIIDACDEYREKVALLTENTVPIANVS